MTLERSAEIRQWTTPGLPVSAGTIHAYSRLAAAWETYRHRLRFKPGPGDDRRFLELTASLRSLMATMWTGTNVTDDLGADQVAGITNRAGFLPGDSARLIYETWTDQFHPRTGKHWAE